ncbi:MAG: SGNH/GDSL hydrolase family protein [Paludibacteraceae bacterium]|nr:SGNH/GDSL hydrolase family protein [Paludibacteraceae bacterium]
METNKIHKVVALGDSITKGVVLDGSRYKILSNSFVDQCREELSLPFDNYARMGCTIERGLEILDRHEQSVRESDMTFLEYGGNDSDFTWQEIADRPDLQHYPHTELPLFVRSYQAMIRRVREWGSQPVLLSLPLMDHERFFEFVSRDMSADARQNILGWLGGQIERIRNYHDMYNLQLFRLAAMERVPIVDITSPFLVNTDYTQCLCEDGIHPSSLGHDMIANQILHNWKPLLSSF